MSNLIKQELPNAPAVYAPRAENIWIDEYLDDKQGEISAYLQVLLKRKRLVLGAAALVFAVAGFRTYTAERVYTSSVNIQIDPEETILPYKEVYATAIPDPRYLGTQAQVLKSEALARRAVTRLKLVSTPSRLNDVARWFAGNVAVTPIEGTQVVKVTYKAPEPDFAAQAVNALAEEYTRYGFESRRESTAQAREFLKNELAKQQVKLEQSEQRLVDYGKAHNILQPTSGENNVVMRKLGELNAEMTRVEAEVLANQYQALQDTPIESFPDKLRTPVMKDLDSRRSDLEQKLATATARFGPKWPEVLTLNQQLTEVQAQLATEKKRAIRQAKVEYDLAVGHRQRLAAALAAQNGLAEQLAQDSIGYDILKREVDTDRQMHEALLQRLKETDVSAGVKSGNVHIIDVGHVPKLPTSPNVPLNLTLGLTFGLVLGIGAALSVEFFDRTIKTPEDVERDLRVAFLAAIPSFDKEWKQATNGHLMPLDAAHSRALPSVGASSSMYWESYRALRTSLLFSADNCPHSILVTSSVAGEGKSTTSVNLAIALAQTGARTLILELDMRRPRLGDRLGLAMDRGISRYLSGQSQLHTEIQQSTIPNLFVILAGPVPPNPPELLGSHRMARVLELLRRHFDYVIIDGPPVLPLTDALVIGPQVNGVVLVVDGHTAREKAQKARNLLKTVDAKVLGVLINNVKVDLPPEYYSYLHPHGTPPTDPPLTGV